MRQGVLRAGLFPTLCFVLPPPTQKYVLRLRKGYRIALNSMAVAESQGEIM